MSQEAHDSLKAYAIQALSDPAANVQCSRAVEGTFHGSMLEGPVRTGAQEELIYITIRRPLPDNSWVPPPRARPAARPTEPDLLPLLCSVVTGAP